MLRSLNTCLIVSGKTFPSDTWFLALPVMDLKTLRPVLYISERLIEKIEEMTCSPFADFKAKPQI